MAYEYSPEGRREGRVGVALLERPSVVFQGFPEGEFIPPYVEVEGYPDKIVPVGEAIKLLVHYTACCPGQPWWAPFWSLAVKAKGDGIAVKSVDWNVLTECETRSDYLKFPTWPIMPDKPVTLEVTLWGNPEFNQVLPLEDP